MGYSKYGNIKTKVDGIVFDSMLEANYYKYLKEQKKLGKIKDFTMQDRFEIFPGYRFQGKAIRKIEYKADFVVTHLDGTTEIIDVKGVETDVFKIKRKLFEHKYQQPIKCLTYQKIDGGWITLEQLKKNRKARKEAKKKG